MTRYARRKVRELEDLHLSGFIFKKDSPTCGLHRVRVYDRNNVPSRTGRGLFAGAVVEGLPLLPVEDEGRLNDPGLRENFFERVFAYRRLRRLFRGRWRLGDLVAFHASEKMLLMAHHPKEYGALGRLVARAKGVPRRQLAEEYQGGFLSALSTKATKGRHANVLRHMAGYFKKALDPQGKRELSELIDDFRKGLVPLVVPVTLIRHYVRLHGVEYLSSQTYLQPHPKELMLRNHV
jgi:uncharacterized protein YbgA (DUF1722 family)